MARQYWIGGFFIDLSRNQITQNDHSQTIPPKALAVLTYLAQNQGKVVSQEALLAEVWQDTAVSPNTLQRCIAQLRKALGDDGKGQVYIKTHAKQGYSLECDVRWQDMAISKSADDSRNREPLRDTAGQPVALQPSLKLAAIVAAIMILGIVGFQTLGPQPTSPLTFNELNSLTATDDKEFDATYTPDGEYIVFHRYLDKLCVNKIWAKNIRTQQEIQLTKDWGAYGRHSFSKDGKQLVFLATEPCNKPLTQKSCYDLVTLDFAEALKSPQQPDLMLQCKSSTVKKPIWLNNGNIALMQRNSEHWKVISYSPEQNQSVDLFVPEEGSIIDYAYSSADEIFAVARIHNDNQQYVEILDAEGRILTSNPINRPPEIARFRPVYPNFDPLNKQLIFSTGRQLFSLTYDGKVTKVDLPFIDRMAQPEFHPDGKRLLMLKGPYDSDIVKLPLNEEQELKTQTSLHQPVQRHQYESFERTNLGEDYAVFQPGGNSIAFWSERSGEQQVWISNGQGARMLTDFPMDTYINGIEWSADGSSLLINANGELIQVFLDSTEKSFPLAHPVVRLYQWDSTNNSALLAVRIKGMVKVVEHDFNSSQSREISDKIVLWARKSQDGQIVFKDHMDQFWRPGPVEPQRIEKLASQGGRAKSFVVKGNVIYAINTDNQLWSYDLNNDDFKILRAVGDDTDYLTDISQSQLLMTIQVAAKKEVVELTLRD